MKDIVFDCIKRTSDVMCVWDCCWLWIRTAEVDSKIIICSNYFINDVGSFYYCVRSLHGALHHPLYRGERVVHECRPLRRGV